MSLRAEAIRVGAVAWKDVLAERRARANIISVLAFAVLVLLLFGFALGPDAEALRAAASGILWVTVLFSAVLAFNRSYQLELEDQALDPLLLYPGDRRSIFLGKLAANIAFVLAVEAVVLPLAAVLYQIPVTDAFPELLLVMLLGTFGIATLGTFYAAMSSRVRARDVMLPLLLFPMLVPLLVASVQATHALLEGDLMGDSASWIRLLAVFDLVFFTAAFLAFEAVIE